MKPQLKFNPLTHIYSVGDVVIMGVSDLLSKHGLSTDYSNVDASFLQPYAEKGNLIHKEISEWIEDAKSGFTKEFANFLSLLDEHDIVPKESELMVDIGWLAGTLDMTCKVNGEMAIVDFKTGSRIYMTALRWQLSLYRRLLGKEVLLFCMHLHDDIVEWIRVKPIPDEQIDELFRCEKDGLLYKQEQSLITENDTYEIARLSTYISDLEESVKVAKKQLEEFKEGIGTLMEKSGVKSLDNEFFKITYVPEVDKATFNSKKFEIEFPELYKSFKETKTTKGYVRITMKKKEEEDVEDSWGV